MNFLQFFVIKYTNQETIKSQLESLKRIKGKKEKLELKASDISFKIKEGKLFLKQTNIEVYVARIVSLQDRSQCLFRMN